MYCDSQSGKCKDTEKIWAIVKNGRLHRLTFSQSLAKMITTQYPEYQICRAEFKIGKRLEKGEKSASGLYALMSKRGDFALRISLIQGISDLHCDDDSCYQAEAWIKLI